MSFLDVKGLTSVLKAVDLNPSLHENAAPEKPLSCQYILATLNNILKVAGYHGLSITSETKVIERDLDRIVEDYSFQSIAGVMQWTRPIPVAYQSDDAPFVAIRLLEDRVVVLDYRSTKDCAAWGVS